MGQEIDITLKTIGPGEFGTPNISSPAVEFVDVSVRPPYDPGGPNQLYRFEAVASGKAVITMKHTEQTESVFTVTIVVD